MRFYALLTALIFFTSAPTFAEQSDDAKKAECIAFYDKKIVLSKAEQENRNEAEIIRLEKEGAIEEAWKLSLASLNPLFEISDKSYECGKYDERFYEVQLNLCAAFTYGQESWGEDGRKYIFEKFGKPYFCDPALQRGDRKAFIHVLKYHVLGLGGEKNYRLAVQHIENFQKNYPESNLIRFASPLYLRGGYSLEKDEEKAFKIIKDSAEKNRNTSLACQLSIYYRDGVGVDKNESEAQNWLKIYKEHNPDKECEFMNFDVLFEEWKWNPAKEESATINAQ